MILVLDSFLVIFWLSFFVYWIAKEICADRRANRIFFGLVFIISLSVLAFVFANSYFHLSLDALIRQGGRCFFKNWPFFRAVGVIALFFGTARFFIENEDPIQNLSPLDLSPPESLKWIYQVRYENLNQEITRYRDLCWKIVLSAWGVYGAILLFNFSSSGSNGWFFILIFSTAVLATIFLAYCEVITLASRRQRRVLERTFKFADPNLAHSARQDQVLRFGPLFSMAVFLSLIWAPPLVLLVLKIPVRG